jgi:DNA-binding GntR family transcriptional regulator
MSAGQPLPNADYRRFESFREYETLFDTLIPQTQSIIRVFDRALPAAWNAPARSSLLRQFLLLNRANRLQVILHDTANIERELPRIAQLNRDFGHAFKMRQTPRMARHLYDPFTVFDASHYLHRFHHAHMRAAIGTHDVEGATQLIDRHLELWEVSLPVSFASPTGL